jgi:hypothetical protein
MPSMRSTLLATIAILVGGVAAGLVPSAPADAASPKKPSRAAAACRPQTFHDERRVGNKCCFVEHFHYGSGGTESSKEKAMAAAAQAWSDFTNFEYGSAYSSFSIAGNKSFSCKGAGRDWSCSVEAIPCHLN